jgi:hypothetical protein
LHKQIGYVQWVRDFLIWKTLAAVLHDLRPELQRKTGHFSAVAVGHPPLFVSAQTFMIAQVR